MEWAGFNNHLVRLSEEIVKKTGINLPVGAVDQFTACTSGYHDTVLTSLQELGMTYAQLSPEYAIVHTGIADQVERLGYISESHSPTRRDAQCAKCMWLHRSQDSVY